MAHIITEKTKLNHVMWKMVIEAPYVARAALAGQFIVLKIDEKGERIPLTVNDADPATGLVTIIFQEAGATTKRLGCLKAGDTLSDVLGPLGKATHFGNVGDVALVAGGVGIAEILPVARYAKRERNRVTTIIGARTKELLILEKELRACSDALIVTTDDGSYGRKALVTEPLKEALSAKTYGVCYAVGPDIMMKAVCAATLPFKVKTFVSLDANMVDATGMCGTCRVTVGGVSKFTCVDGPEFDGHLIDWDEFLKRQKRFIVEEKASLEAFEHQHANCMYKG